MDEGLKRLRGGEDAFFLFFGTEDATTGQSWCSDCVVACPAVRGAFASEAPVEDLVEVPVGPRSAWATADHPLKSDAELAIDRVPTLVHVVGGSAVKRLVETECFDRAAVSAFFRSSAATAAAVAGSKQ